MDIARILRREWLLCSVALLACVMIVIGIVSGSLGWILPLVLAMISAAAALPKLLGKRPTEDDFWQALRGGDPNIDRIKWCLKKGMNPNILREDGSMTALILAISKGQARTVRLLLTYKADVNLCNCDGVSPLGTSILTARPHIEKILRDKGAEDRNEEGVRLVRAIEVGDIPTALELIKA